MWYDMIWHDTGIIWYMIWYDTVYGMVWYGMIWYNINIIYKYVFVRDLLNCIYDFQFAVFGILRGVVSFSIQHSMFEDWER